MLLRKELKLVDLIRLFRAGTEDEAEMTIAEFLGALSYLLSEEPGDSADQLAGAISSRLSPSAVILHNGEPSSGANQDFTIEGSPSSGTFSLAFRGYTTSDIPFDATTADVIAALEALPSIGVGNIRACEGYEDYTLLNDGELNPQFICALGARPVELPRLVDGTDGSLVVDEGSSGYFPEPPGPGGVNQEYYIGYNASQPSTGSFRLRFRGSVTTLISFDATVLEIVAVLEALPSIGANNVGVSNSNGDYDDQLSDGDTVYLQFQNGLGFQSVESFVIEDDTTDGELYVDEEEVGQSLTGGALRAGQLLLDTSGEIHRVYEFGASVPLGSSDELSWRQVYPLVTETALASVAARIPAVPTSIVISAPGGGLALTGDTRQFSAVVKDVNSVVLAVPVAWHSDDEGVATINEVSGLLSAVGAGTCNITARIFGFVVSNAVILECVGAPLTALSDLGAVDVLLDADALSLSNGTAVASYTDQSGNLRPYLQALAGKKPVVVAAASNFNGNDVVRFDAVDDFVKPAAYKPVAPFTQISVHAFRSLGDRLVTSNSGSGGWSGLGQAAPSKVEYNSHGIANVKGATGSVQVDVALVQAVTQGDSGGSVGPAKLYKNGLLVASNAASSHFAGAGQEQLGDNANFAAHIADFDHGLLVSWPSVQTPTDVYRASRFLMARFGVA